ncbi:DNA (cytosine-5-)-methyltransferase [Enterococcus faecium]|uniref:DNA cytosine methyltransferase n=1 Tax=Enterococcus faecium TaxID=1352 RepID=UPI0002A2BE3B|nr:DNA (cytosine-5-)-methyltransferase [Enterococcus faecium]EGP5072427.1 DNA (cytosine-5-)-methyltransferase [Enterococcus faecium]EGP5490079.1 DNA (cytosine-5-)-methyltransferase [Enterococcus faecium]ELB49415.1 DNA (cytosine-5-)-methyltransferase [Enterococcus faecium EnGen0038]EME3508791.1 DNA (cytosine-5-)-methyltransferase [Enterococcus faecium]EME3523976.1 DNA (cytosine-5-)-methyltransferase [Enterococcus faecium]
MKNSKIKVAEMFAGVGGFHLGLKKASDKFEVVWANQYEPSRKNQFAYRIYVKNFPDTYAINEDISSINKDTIPPINLLVGGFPCQDYSVASSGAKGLYGKKGVLWWDIRDVVKKKWPEFIFLENVDRLLTSPGVGSANPGRDFGMILRTLSDLGYGITWKMINAADYGFPQRRRRTFIFAFRKDLQFMQEIKEIVLKGNAEIERFIKDMPPFSSTLKNKRISEISNINLYEYENLKDFSDNFKINRGFRQTGLSIDGQVYMANYEPELREKTTLEKIVEYNLKDERLYLSPEKIEKFKILKNGFQTTKVSKTGYEYKYGMGKVPFPDPLTLPARTMVTSEHTISRMSHVIEDPGNRKLRLISPEESELINTFPKGWTKLDGVTDSNRYFTMGNALVVDLVTEIGKEICEIADTENLDKEYEGQHFTEKIVH